MSKKEQPPTTSSAYISRTEPFEQFVMVYLDGREPEDVIERDGIFYDRTDHLNIDLDAIPEHVLRSLAECVLEQTREYFRQPGVEEEYQKWLAERRKKEKIGKSKSSRTVKEHPKN